MVYTVTFNPAVDYVVRIDKMTAGTVNRLDHEEIVFGGKGINVSLVLKELGIKSKALGFIAGFTGKAIRDGVEAAGVKTDFTELDSGFSRINVKIKSEEETELNGRGPEIKEKDIKNLFEKLDRLSDGDTLVLAGSIPAGVSPDIYEQILARLSGKKIKAVVDASKELLLNVLKYKPFLVKPNNFELEEMFGVKINSVDEIITYGKKMKEMGAENVLVSMAGEGAVLIDENGNIHRCRAAKGEVKNSVGAGDSMVAGFIAGISEGDYSYALKLGTAAGGATAFSYGIAEREFIMKLLKEISQ